MIRRIVGSPPRMRGKLDCYDLIESGFGITPADAGKTSRHLVGINQSQDHPRGCGENDVRLRKFDPVPGSPPRMRGKLIDSILSFSMPRITPADAGKT